MDEVNERLSLEDIDLNQEVFSCHILLKHKERYLEAIEEGYKDEVCGRCKVYFAAYRHSIICDSKDCPMKGWRTVSP